MKQLQLKSKRKFPLIIAIPVALLIIAAIFSVAYCIFFSETKDSIKLLVAEGNIKSSDFSETENNIPNLYEFKLINEWITLIPKDVEETEWIIVVDRSEQKDYIFQNHALIKNYTVSTGSATRYEYDATLPLGIWQIGTKYPYSLGEIYGPRLMYIEWWNGETFVHTNQALHGTNEPENLGQATSMGCVYHSNEDITELYDLIPEGTIVITVE